MVDIYNFFNNMKKKYIISHLPLRGDTQVIHFLYFFISPWIVCLQQQGQNFLNSNRLGVLCRFFWVIYLEIPVDFLLTLFRTQLVHSKITLIRISLPLAMNLLCVFDSLNSSILRFEAKRNKKEKKIIEVANSKSNYEGSRSNH